MSEDVAWFERLFHAHYDDVLRYAARRVGPDAASDVAAEVFTVAWRRRDEYGRDAARLWLFGVARGVVANVRRGQDRALRLTALLAVQAATAADPTSTDPGTAVTCRLHVLEMFEQLAEPDAELLRLTEWDGLTNAEAAVVLGCSASALRVRLHRARRRAAAVLDQLDASEREEVT